MPPGSDYLLVMRMRSSSSRTDFFRSSTPSSTLFPRFASQPQFIAKDFMEFIRISGMTHVRTSPYYRNRTERSKQRPGTPLSLEDARRLVQGYVEHYNTAKSDRKLEVARRQR